MKKVVSIILTIAMLLGCSVAFAEDMSVQVVSGPEIPMEEVSLDDIKIDAEVEIPGYAIIKPTLYAVRDHLGYYDKGGSYNSVWGWTDYRQSYHSGNEADYVLLKMDITNTTASPRNFISNCEVMVVFDDDYKYAGWAYQYNYDFGQMDYPDGGKSNTECVINAADVFDIDPWYAGHYVFGCTIPNAVLKSNKPMRMEIKLDGNELTYNIRK